MWHFIEKLLEVVIPEERQLAKLLSLEPSIIRKILPRSNLYQRDVSALFDYQNKMVRLLVKAVKFRNNPRARKIVAGFLYEELLEIQTDKSLFTGSSPILLAMPMSKKEKIGRGYNQSEELVKEIARIAEGRIQIEMNLLQKIRDTERQVHLSRQARLKNLKGAMQVFDPQQILQDKNIVVLDDIFTTGSTFAEARRALLLAGARSVYGLFIAH